MATSQPLVETTIASQPLRKTMAIVRLIDLVLIEIMWSMLKNQENYLSQENQKAKKCLSLKILLSQEKSCQKVGIQLILMLQKLDLSF